MLSVCFCPSVAENYSNSVYNKVFELKENFIRVLLMFQDQLYHSLSWGGGGVE